MPKSGSTPKITRRTALTGLSASAALLAMPRLGRAADETIRIGFPTPLTGPFGTEAQDQVRCAEIAIKEFNESGGLNGRMAELLVRDDKLNPGEAATRTLELTRQLKFDRFEPIDLYNCGFFQLMLGHQSEGVALLKQAKEKAKARKKKKSKK